MASRLLASSGGDHTTLEDWEAWATNPANFGAAANWDDPVNGGHQIIRVADQTITFTSPQQLAVGALATATNYKVTIRPNTEGGVTSVGAKIAADGFFDATTIIKTPGLAYNAAPHRYVIDVSGSPGIEWHFEDLSIGPAMHRSGPIQFSSAMTRNSYVDRCLLYDRATGLSNLRGGGLSTAGGKLYFRSCIIQGVEVPVFAEGSNTFFLGCHLITAVSSNAYFTAPSSNILPIRIYGCAIAISTTDAGSSGTVFNRAAANFVNGYNVLNIPNTGSWATFFGGTASNVMGSTRANMFVSTTNHFPKENGSLYGVVSWADLPAEVQNAWPDKDIRGTSIVKSGSFSAGAIYVTAGPAEAILDAELSDENDAVSAVGLVRVGGSAALVDASDVITSAFTTTYPEITAEAALTDADDIVVGGAGVTITAAAALAPVDDSLVAGASLVIQAHAVFVDTSDAVNAGAGVHVAVAAPLEDASDGLAGFASLSIGAAAPLVDDQDHVIAGASVIVTAVTTLADGEDMAAAAASVIVRAEAILADSDVLSGRATVRNQYQPRTSPGPEYRVASLDGGPRRIASSEASRRALSLEAERRVLSPEASRRVVAK